MKISQDAAKLTIPGRKVIYRIIKGEDEYAEYLIDVIQTVDEPPPEAGKRHLCRHPFEVQYSTSHVRDTFM